MRFGDEIFIPRLPTSRGYIPQTFVVWWAGLDSNQRIPKEEDLQSSAIAAMRPTHIEAEWWHRRSVSLTALIYYCELAVYKDNSFNFSSLARDMPQCHNCGMAGDRGDDPLSFGSKPNVSTGPLIPNIY